MLRGTDGTEHGDSATENNGDYASENEDEDELDADENIVVVELRSRFPRPTASVLLSSKSNKLRNKQVRSNRWARTSQEFMSK